MKKYALLLSVLALPYLALAQTFSAQNLIINFIAFSNRVLVPFLIGLAFLIFTINVIRFFVFKGSNEKGREAAKNLAIYSVMAFVVIIIFWGVVNVFADGIGLEGKNAPNPDYLQKHNVQLKTDTNTPGSAATKGTQGTTGSDQVDDILGGSKDPCSSGADFNENGNPCGIY